MDDTAQSNAQPSNQQGASSTSAPQVPEDTGETQAQPTASQPFGLPHKELGPSMPTTQDYGSISLSEPEPYIPEEVAEAGVEATPDTYKPDIPDDVAKLGVTPAKAATPVVTTTTTKVVLPLTEEKAVQAKKTYTIKDSIRWLAELVLEQLKRAQEKVIH